MEKKSVLISIHPQWCHKIVDGYKTIELRKKRPNMKTPFTCYIYMTSGGWEWRDCWTTAIMPPCGKLYNGAQKVIGEFTCNYITQYDYVIDHQFYNIDPLDKLSMCLTTEEIETYGDTKPLYGWHISDLVIYDKPKELSEFWESDKCPYASNDGCLYKYHCFRAGQMKRCGETIERPPQSWRYVVV